MKKNWWIIVVILISLAVTSDFLKPNFPYTHDGENHLARMANYKVALREGQYPPRFAPNLFNHYGYPVLNFNYPLVNILSLPLSLLKINYEVSFKVIVILSVMAAAIFLPLLAEKIIGKKIRNFQKVLISATYLSAPYLTNALIFRGSIGEVMATSLAVLSIYFQILYFEKRSKLRIFLATLAWSMFFLSHNVSVMILTPLIIVFLLTINWNKSFNQTIKNWSPFIYGVSLSLWFWLPAWFERSEIIVSSAGNQSDVFKHFISFYQLFENKVQFGFSQIGSIDTLSFSIGLVAPIIFSLAIIQMFNKKFKAAHAFLLTASFFAVLMQLDISKSIYQSAPILNFVQFPWRFSGLLLISLPLLLSLVINNLRKTGEVIISVILLVQLTILVNLKPVDYFHKNIIDYEAFSQSTSTQNENLPTTFTYLGIDDWQPSPTIIEGSGEIKVIKWNGSYRNYQIMNDEFIVITEPTMNFLGWQTYIRPLNTEKFELVRYIDSELIGGRLAYRLSPGSYEIISRFTQRTPARVVGNGIFIISLACFACTLVRRETQLV